MGRVSLRLYLYVLVAGALIIILLTIPNTPVHAKTKTYVQDLLKGKPKAPETNFSTDKWFYQSDLDDLPLMQFDFDRLRALPPVNYAGPGHETFATFYATRDATMHDPYFSAAQQIVYRLLWKQKSKSKKHPVTVFVSSHVNETQREYFTAAGAIVRELALRPFEPSMFGVPARLQDMFSKLEMWRQLDFSKIAYVDCDAIPIENIDGIFDQAKEQYCIPARLQEEDKPYASDICKYVFAAHSEKIETINAGVMIFKPESAMYRRLVRGSQNTTGWDTGYLEQSLISYLYHPDGPFPPISIDPGYNSFPDYREKGIEIKILHDKMWAHYFDPGSWVDDEWKDTWTEMEAFYKSEEFYQARLKMRDDIEGALEKEVKKHPHVAVPEIQPR